MTIEQKLSMALSYKGISQSELARRIGTTPQNLNQKVKRNTLTKEELEQHLRAYQNSGNSLLCYLGQHLKEDIVSLLDLIRNDKPGVAEKAAETSKNI